MSSIYDKYAAPMINLTQRKREIDDSLARDKQIPQLDAEREAFNKQMVKHQVTMYTTGSPGTRKNIALAPSMTGVASNYEKGLYGINTGGPGGLARRKAESSGHRKAFQEEYANRELENEKKGSIVERYFELCKQAKEEEKKWEDMSDRERAEKMHKQTIVDNARKPIKPGKPTSTKGFGGDARYNRETGSKHRGL